MEREEGVKKGEAGQDPRVLPSFGATVAGSQPDAEAGVIGKEQWQAIHERRRRGMSVSVAGVKRDRADLAKRGLSLRKLAAVTSMLVKLARPPPEMRIFSATFSLWSSTKTLKPNWPATPAQNRPAAPAPTITTSKLCMGCSVYFQR